MKDFKDHKVTAVLRLGDRLNVVDFKHLPDDVDLPVRFIKRPGVGHEMPAVLYPDDGTTVRRVGAVVKPIKDLTAEDLLGTTPDTASPELVRYHLALINNSELPSPEELVTVWRLAYQPNAQ